MLSERQRNEDPPRTAAENTMQPPPSYGELNGVFASQSNDGSMDALGYFLGEVNIVVFLISHSYIQIVSTLFLVLIISSW